MSTAEVDLHRLELAYADLRVLDRRHVAKLAGDIAAEGQRQPVLVVECESRLVLIDGYCRVAALRLLGRDTAIALKLALTERDALLFAYRSSSGRRRFALEDGWLMRELIERFAMKQTDVALLLGRSDSFVSRRLAIVVQLPDSIQQAVRNGLIGAHAAQRSLVPLARANREHAERLVANLGGLRPTTRQLAAIYAAWRAADAETRERIVGHPALFLKAVQVDDEAPLPDPVADLVRGIETIAGACHGARKRLRAFALHTLEGANREAVVRAFGEARHAFGGVQALLTEEGLDA